MSRKIVHDDCTATLEFRNQTLFEILDEDRPVHWSINHERCNNPIMAQAGHESEGLPVAVRHLPDQSLAAGAAASRPHLVGAGGGLVEKHQPRRVKHALLSIPTPARAGYVRSVLLRGAQAFFKADLVPQQEAPHRAAAPRDPP